MRLIIRPGHELDGTAEDLTCNGLTLDDAAGIYADEVARTFGVRGGSFTLKADGVELSRTGRAPSDAQVLELIEATIELPLDAVAFSSVTATIAATVTLDGEG